MHLVLDGISSQRLTDRQTALTVSMAMCTVVQPCYILCGSASQVGRLPNATVWNTEGFACRELHRVEPFWAHQKCCSFRSCKELRYCAERSRQPAVHALAPCNQNVLMQHPAFKAISTLFKQRRVPSPLPGKL